MAEALLVDAGGEAVNGNDPPHVGFDQLGVTVENFVFRVINHDPATAHFRPAVENQFLPDRENLLHVGHVEPATDESVSEDTATGWFDHGFEESSFPATEFCLGIGDHSVKADGFRLFVVGKRVKMSAVLVAFRIVFQQIRDMGKSQFFQSVTRFLIESNSFQI